ncbi:hypothetical protein Salat_0665100, partial [Sesamum alatum]
IKRRGRTRNVALSKRKNANEKLTVRIPEEVNRIVGVNSQFAITESGCLTRRFAPLQVTKWAKIEEGKKLDLLRDFIGSFDSGDYLRCDRAILSQMNTQYRNYRHKLYKNYFLRGIIPAHVDPEDWEYLSTYFSSEEYQEEKNGDVVGPIELYKLTRYKYEKDCEDGCWLLIERQATGENLVDEEQICAEVLGYKSGYIRGRGAGPKPNRSWSKQSYWEELENAKRNARIAQERANNAEQQMGLLERSSTKILLNVMRGDNLLHGKGSPELIHLGCLRAVSILQGNSWIKSHRQIKREARRGSGHWMKEFKPNATNDTVSTKGNNTILEQPHGRMKGSDPKNPTVHYIWYQSQAFLGLAVGKKGRTMADGMRFEEL